MSYCKEHPTWIYVRYTTNDVQSALRRQADLFEEAGSHGFLVRGTSFDKCGGNSLKDRDGLRSMLDMILLFMQKHGAVLITTKTNLRYELYLTGLESRLLNHPLKTDGCVWEYEDYENAKC